MVVDFYKSSKVIQLERIIFSPNGAEVIVYLYVKKKKKNPQPLPYIIYKNQTQVDYRPKC